MLDIQPRYEITVLLSTDLLHYHDNDEFLSVFGTQHRGHVLNLPSRTIKAIKADLAEDEIYYDDLEIIHWKAA